MKLTYTMVIHIRSEIKKKKKRKKERKKKEMASKILSMSEISLVAAVSEFHLICLYISSCLDKGFADKVI